MPVTTLIRAGGVAAVLVAPLGVTASASGNTIAASWLAGPVPGLIKGVRIYGQRVSEAADAYEPATWTLLEYLNTGTNFSDRSYIWDRDPINLRFCYVGVDNSNGPFTVISNVSVVWGPLNQLSLFNQDLTQAVWAKDAGVTVTGTAGSQTATFTAANQQVIQSCPALLNGQIYTFYHRIQGTAGQTIQLTSYDQDTATSQDFVHTFDGTVQDVVFTRTFGSTGRRLLTGANTYGAVTARTFTTFRTAVSNGTFTQAQMIANWALTQGPGTTRQEPISQVGPLTVTGWHHSPLQTVPAINIGDGVFTITGARLSGLGDIIKANAQNPSIIMTNSRTWAMHPMTNGVTKGKVVFAAYGTQLIAENNSFRSGMGIYWQYGRSTPSIRVRYNIHRDLDGRFCTAAGGYVLSAYSTIQNRPPGALLGYDIANFFKTQGSFDSLNPPQGIDCDRNEASIRPGYGRGEDTNSHLQTRGNATTPYFVRNNMYFHTAVPWDYVWHVASNPAVPYNYGNILSTFNLLLTVAAGGALAGATVINLSQNLYLTAYSIPNGTTLTFTGGKTAVVNGPQGGSRTTLTVNALVSALNAGDTATITGVQDGPGPFSGTGIMMGDGILYPVNVAGTYEKQTRWGRAENNLTIGASEIQSICIGSDLEIRAGTLVYTGKMYDGLLPDDGSRPAFLQINTFGQQTITALDAGGVAQLISARYGVNNTKIFGAGGGISMPTADNLPAQTYGNKPVAAIKTHFDAVAMCADWRAEAVALGLTIGPTS